jgi:hypothetical protein
MQINNVLLLNSYDLLLDARQLSGYWAGFVGSRRMRAALK